MIFTELFETKTSALTEGVRVVDQDYDLDQIILTMDINGRPVSFTYTDYDEDFDNAERGDVHDQLQRNDWYAALSHPDRMEILDAAYRAIRGEEPGEYRPTVDDEPMDVGDRLDEKGVSENTVKGKPFQKTMVRPEEAYKLLAGQEPKAFAIDVLMPDQSAVKRLQAAIGNQAKIRGDDSIAGDGVGIQIVTPVFPDGRTAQQAFEMMMDVIRTHGGGFNRSTGAIIAAPASQDVAEAMKPSDIPPGRRDRLTMRDIEAERPEGAFRFRVVTPKGDAIDFMDQAAAEQRARALGGRVEPIDPQPQGRPGRNRFRVQDPQGSRPAATFQDRAAAERYASAKKLPVEIIPEERNKPGARIERILKMLRARHPQAENDLEALIFDFRGQQAQDRSDIARLDAENDAEEADIQRLERMLDLIRRRRGAAAAEPVQEDDIDDAMRDYLARGGKVQQEPARMPRLGTRLRQHGSRHIGQGREGRAGQLSGRGANTNPGGNKPVVATEGLRDGEYHVATVTLDDGTKKKVRITTDEGFRDRIQRYFAKQGRTVQDIDVDFSVRSKFDENKPTFTGAPARPQPQPVAPTKVLPQAPGRPGFVNKPVQETKKKPQPTNPELWSRAKAAARSKFDVYPSAYANAWAAKWYKSKGGGWRMGKPKKD